MFGFSVHTVVTPDHLVVTSPFSFGLLITLGLMIVWPLGIFVTTKPLPRRKLIVWSVLFLLAFGMLPSQSRLTLDRPTNTVEIHSYAFFYWSTERFPLSSLDSASIRTGNLSDRIQLQFVGGDTRGMSEYNQMGGKEKAVYQINQFLGNGK